MSEGEYIFKVDLEHMDTCTFDQYLQDFVHIFKISDVERDATDLWLNVIHHGSKFAELIRRKETGQVLDELADVIVWTISFVAKLENPVKPFDFLFKLDRNITDMLWEKYPAICPVCFERFCDSSFQDIGIFLPGRENTRRLNSIIKDFALETAKVAPSPGSSPISWCSPCTCLIDPNIEERKEQLMNKITKHFDEIKKQKLSKEERLNTHRHINERKNECRRLYAKELKIKLVEQGKDNCIIQGLQQFQDMFEKIYMTKVRWGESLDTVAFHLLEEIGEISHAMIGMYTFNAQEDQLPAKDEIENRRRYARRMRKKRIKQLEEEIADVFSWIFSVNFKIRENFSTYKAYMEKRPLTSARIKVAEGATENIASLIWVRYGGIQYLQCPKCGQAPCERIKGCDWYIYKPYKHRRNLGSTSISVKHRPHSLG